ncbi:MAG: hypothetical protein GF383_12200 [Candidatus Lokiarchaeota archaeon]|nr:hypothetical protein [Candidatus Lokiarchaeota archaeon]MBD3341754.1 hypothetical protein [Candidatus Lokiarchaeota archaeon]
MDIAIDAEGNRYITGYRYPSETVEGCLSFLFKVNSNGNLLLNITVGNNGTFSEALTLDEDGNIYVTGYNDDTIGGEIFAFVEKFNNTGHSK